MGDENFNIHNVTDNGHDMRRRFRMENTDPYGDMVEEQVQYDREHSLNGRQRHYPQDQFYEYQDDNSLLYDQNISTDFQGEIQYNTYQEYQPLDSDVYQQGNIAGYQPNRGLPNNYIQRFPVNMNQEYQPLDNDLYQRGDMYQQGNIAGYQPNGNYNDQPQNTSASQSTLNSFSASNETSYASQISLNKLPQSSQQSVEVDTTDQVNGILQMEGSVEPNGPVLGGQGYIPAQTIQKAYYDLGETPEIKAACLRGLRQQIEIHQEENNFDEHTDAFLLKFLRGRKFDVEAAYSLLEKYYNVRENKPEVFRNLTRKNVKRTMEQGIVGVLPQRDKRGRVIVTFNFSAWNMSLPFHFEKLLRVFVYTLEKLFESEETQINGIVIISNLSQLSVLQTKNLGAPMIAKILDIFQDNLPFRLNAIHLLNPPWHFKLLWKMVDPLTKIKPKIARRIYIHDGDMSRFQAEFDPELLPKELGGKCPPYDNNLWVRELLGPDQTPQQISKLKTPSTPSRRRSPSPARRAVNR